MIELLITRSRQVITTDPSYLSLTPSSLFLSFFVGAVHSYKSGFVRGEKEASPSHELIETMQLLCTLLGGVPETETRSYCNNAEMIYLEVDDITPEKIVATVEKAGLQIFPVIYKQSREDESLERDYLILGTSISTTKLELYTGATTLTGRLIASVIKETPHELVFLAIETPVDDELLIDLLDPDEENDVIEIFINSHAEIVTAQN